MPRRRVGTYQMLWDCSCGAGPLLGVDHRHCPSCGRPQDPERRYFPDQRDAVPAPQWLARSGRDLHCPFCKTANARAAACCTGCGGPMGGASPVALRDANHGTAAETVADALAEARNEAHERREALEKAHRTSRREPLVAPTAAPLRKRRPDVSAPARRGWDHRRWALFGGIGIAVLAAVWAIFFWEKDVTVEVDSRSWSRSQEVERYSQVSDSAWCDTMPPDAYDVDRRSRQRGTRTVVECRACDCRTERVRVGQTCQDVNCRTVRTDNGNGSFSVDTVCERECTPNYEDRQTCSDRTHEEPVYDSWCEYLVNRWRVARTPRDEGTMPHAPAWPNLGLHECTVARLGCERPARRSETYRVKFKDDEGHVHDCEYTQQTWGSFDEGTLWRGAVRRLGDRLVCDELVRLTVEREAQI